MYRDIPSELLRLVEPVVCEHGLEVVDARAGHGGGRLRIQIIVDTPACDGRVTIDACAAVSREIEHGLDAAGYNGGNPYGLEVCSPGVNRMLGREKDFKHVVGQRVALETREPIAGQRRFRGELIAFDGEAAELRTDSGGHRIPFEAISRAQAFYPFPEGGAAR